MKPVIWKPFTQMQLLRQLPKVKSTKGAFLYLEDGTAIIDAVSSWWVINHGHCESKIVEAISEQSKKLDQVLFANFEHDRAEELVSLLNGFLPDQLSNYFFSDNGSTAVEVALKMALQFWQQSGKPEKHKFLCLQSAYHGDTVGAMSLSADSVFTKPYEKLLIPTIKAKHARFSNEDIDAYCNDVLNLIKEQSDKIAAIFLEPLVQGAGGMIVWPKEALQKIVSSAKKHDVLVVFDEVMTGFGRTGAMFAFDQIEGTPDILCLSKGLTGGTLPLALTVTSPKVFEAFLSTQKEKMFFHGHSFTGNAISCAAAIASLQLFQEKDYFTKWKQIESLHKANADTIKEHPLVLDIRIQGTIAAIELEDNLNGGYTSSFGPLCCEFSLEREVFLRPLGNVLYILPPYCCELGQINRVWEVIKDFLYFWAAKNKL